MPYFCLLHICIIVTFLFFFEFPSALVVVVVRRKMFVSVMSLNFYFYCLEAISCLFFKRSFNLDQLLSRLTTATPETHSNVFLGSFPISSVIQLLSSNLSLICGNTF